jgi:hypothetical protein
MIKSTICIAEDRLACEPSIKILVLSLNAHCPEVMINLFYPPAGREFMAWIEKYPQVRIQTEQLTEGAAWNVKPQAIMHLLDQGYDEVLWIDSDVIVTRSIIPLFSDLTRQTFVASDHTLANERWDPNALRARLWGFQVGRVLPFAVSSGVLRATQDHYHLMERWWELLQSKEYQDSHQKGWKRSPIHMKGDQDVLTALLTSTEFSQVPIRLLRRGREIVLFDGIFGYTVWDRVRNLLWGAPALVHIAGLKPWSANWRLEPPVDLKQYLEHVYFDVSPYTLSALRFRHELGCGAEWMQPHYVLSRVLRALGVGSPALAGLPIAAFADLARIGRAIYKSKVDSSYS